MSTIVAVEKNGHTVVAWDTLTTIGSTANVNAIPRPKVRQVGDMVLGSAGLSVYKNILDDYLKSCEIPVIRDETGVLNFFLEFWRGLHSRYHFVDDHYDEDGKTPFADVESEFVVVNRTGIYLVAQILSVTRYEKFCAIGSGAPHAEGALSVMYDTETTIHDMARRAVEVAVRFDTKSGGDILVLEVPNE